MAGTLTSELLSHIKFCKLRYFGHVLRQPHDSVDSSVTTVLVEGVRRQGRRQRICWFDNITAWTGMSEDSLLNAVRDRSHLLMRAANCHEATMAQ